MSGTPRNGKSKEDLKEETAEQQKKDASFSFFLHGTLFLFFLTSYTFLLFLHKNKYPLFLNNEILPEVLFACFGLLVFSFASLLLFSFWRLLARAFIAIVAGGATAYILGLIYPFNVGNYFAHYVSFLPKDILLYVAGNGNQIVGILAGFSFFVILNVFKGGAMAFLSLPVLTALFLLLNTASKQIVPEFKQTPSLADSKAPEKTENLIYLILADHTGYGIAAENWQTLNAPDASPESLPLAPTFIPSFYQENGFVFHPNAYLRYQDKYRNIGNVLNPSLTEIGNDMFNRDDAAYYVSSEDAQVYSNRNDLFKELKKRGYRLHVYQTYPFDFCKGAGESEAASCVTYPAPMGALYQTDMTTSSRLMLLVGHWLYSTPFGKSLTGSIYNALKNKVNLSNVPYLGNPLSLSLPVGQPAVLARLRKDVLEAGGKNAFFAHINLPRYPYVYDRNCKFKTDPMKWRGNAPYSEKTEINGELKRWEDYNQQLFCTYGQLNYLIKELEAAKLADKTTIVIHGDKGANIQKETIDQAKLSRGTRIINRFKNNMTTIFAIRSPEKKKAEVNKEICDVATLTAKYLIGNQELACQQPDMPKATTEEMNNALDWLKTPVREEYLSVSAFEPLYASWLENGGQAFMSSLDEQLKQSGNEQGGAGKISFVAPPVKQEARPEKEQKKKAEKAKTTDFVPVPEKDPERNLSEELPAIGIETEQATVEKAAPEKTVAPPEPEQATESLPDIFSDDLGALPKPIVLPETDASVEDRWKTTNIKEGQKTTLELLPDSVLTEEANKEKEKDEPSAPQAATTPSVEILPLPELAQLPESPAEIAESPVAVLPELSALPEPAVDLPEIKAEEEKAKAEAEAKAKVEAEAKAKAEAEAKAKAEAEAKAKAEAEAKAKAEAEAKAKAEAEAKAKAEARARIKAEMEARAKARAEAEAKAKAEEEARAKAEAEEEARKKLPPPPPANVDQLDITREKITEYLNEDGEVETFIFIERKPNPNRFKKKAAPQRILQQDLEHVPAKPASTVPENVSTAAASDAPVEKSVPAVDAEKTQAAPEKQEQSPNDTPESSPAVSREAPAAARKQTVDTPQKSELQIERASPVERVLED